MDTELRISILAQLSTHLPLLYFLSCGVKVKEFDKFEKFSFLTSCENFVFAYSKLITSPLFQMNWIRDFVLNKQKIQDIFFGWKRIKEKAVTINSNNFGVNVNRLVENQRS